MSQLDKIVSGCRKGEKSDQKQLFQKYAPILRGISYRYAGSNAMAEDILQEGFIKIFAHIKQYSNQGSFEGWIKRIIINTAITHVKRANKNRLLQIDEVNETQIIDYYEEEDVEVDASMDSKSAIKNAHFSQDEIMEVVSTLPDGYRMVFNLYAVEGYKHREIAEMLNIDINTSKSQLNRARKLIQKKLYEVVLQKLVIKNNGITKILKEQS